MKTTLPKYLFRDLVLSVDRLPDGQYREGVTLDRFDLKECVMCAETPEIEIWAKRLLLKRALKSVFVTLA